MLHIWCVDMAPFHTESSVTPNSALLTDTYTSPLRARGGAAERGRYVAEAFSYNTTHTS